MNSKVTKLGSFIKIALFFLLFLLHLGFSDDLLCNETFESYANGSIPPFLLQIAGTGSGYVSNMNGSNRFIIKRNNEYAFSNFSLSNFAVSFDSAMYVADNSYCAVGMAVRLTNISGTWRSLSTRVRRSGEIRVPQASGVSLPGGLLYGTDYTVARRYQLLVYGSASATTIVYLKNGVKVTEHTTNFLSVSGGNGMKGTFGIGYNGAVTDAAWFDNIKIYKDSFLPCYPVSAVQSGAGAVVTFTNIYANNSGLSFQLRRSSNTNYHQSVVAGSSVVQSTASVTLSDVAGAGEEGTFYYWVTLTGSDLRSSPIAVTITGIPTELPGNPTLSSVSAPNFSTAILSWGDVSNEMYYVLYRSNATLGGANIKLITLAANSTSYKDNGLSELTLYRYTILASNTLGASALSPSVGVTTPAIPANINGPGIDYGENFERYSEGSLPPYITKISGSGSGYITNIGGNNRFGLTGDNQYAFSNFSLSNFSLSFDAQMIQHGTGGFNGIKFLARLTNQSGWKSAGTRFRKDNGIELGNKLIGTTPETSTDLRHYDVFCYGPASATTMVYLVNGVRYASFTTNFATLSGSTGIRGTIGFGLSADATNIGWIDNVVLRNEPALPCYPVSAVQSGLGADVTFTNIYANNSGLSFQLRRSSNNNYAHSVVAGSSVVQSTASVTLSDTVGPGINGTYYYWVTFTGSDLRSLPISVTITGIPTELPGNPTLSSVSSPNFSTAILSWNDVSNELSYIIYRSNATLGGANIKLITLAANSTSYVDNGLSELTLYRYSILASNSYGASALSPSFGVTTPANISEPGIYYGENFEGYSEGSLPPYITKISGSGSGYITNIGGNNRFGLTGDSQYAFSNFSLSNFSVSFDAHMIQHGTGNFNGIKFLARLTNQSGWKNGGTRFRKDNQIELGNKIIGTTPGSSTDLRHYDVFCYGPASATTMVYLVNGVRYASFTTNFATLSGSTGIRGTIGFGLSADATNIGWIDNVVLRNEPALPCYPVSAVQSGSGANVIFTNIYANNSGLSFQLRRSSNNNYAHSVVASSSVVQSTASVTLSDTVGPGINGTYYYWVTLTGSDLRSSPISVTITGLTTDLPGNVTFLPASAPNFSTVILSWNDVSNELSYIIYRSNATLGGANIKLNTLAANSTSYKDNGLSELTLYRYSILASNVHGASALSPYLSVTTPAIPANVSGPGVYYSENFERYPEGSVPPYIAKISGSGNGYTTNIGGGNRFYLSHNNQYAFSNFSLSNFSLSFDARMLQQGPDNWSGFQFLARLTNQSGWKSVLTRYRRDNLMEASGILFGNIGGLSTELRQYEVFCYGPASTTTMVYLVNGIQYASITTNFAALTGATDIRGTIGFGLSGTPTDAGWIDNIVLRTNLSGSLRWSGQLNNFVRLIITNMRLDGMDLDLVRSATANREHAIFACNPIQQNGGTVVFDDYSPTVGSNWYWVKLQGSPFYSGPYVVVATTLESQPGQQTAWWPCDEGSGTIIRDVTTNKYDITNETAYWTLLENGENALRFDGGNSFLNVPGAFGIEGSIALSVYPYSFENCTAQVPQFLIGYPGESDYNKLNLYVPDSGGTLVLDFGDKKEAGKNITALNVSNWNQIVFCWTKTNWSLYHDGILKSIGNATGFLFAPARFDIGNSGVVTNRLGAFNGLIRDIRLFNYFIGASDLEGFVLPPVSDINTVLEMRPVLSERIFTQSEIVFSYPDPNTIKGVSGVIVLDILGKFIWEGTFDEKGYCKWNGKNSNGKDVPTGAYLVVVHDQNKTVTAHWFTVVK